MSLAALKRRIKVGTVVATEHDHVYADTFPAQRTVTRVQSNGIAFGHTRPDGEVVDSWIYWPRAAEVQVDGDRFVIGGLNDKLAYRIIEDAP